MKIEVLYVPGCPHYQPAVDRIQKLLTAASLRVNIERVRVSSDAEARALQFPGSPTIRIDGIDVEAPQGYVTGLACRLYANRSGVPSEEILALALARASDGRAWR
jgi:hypothetical protein